jgi:hypothetical protein
MHLLVILLQQLLGLLPNKQQAQPEPVRVRTTPPSNRGANTPEQQAFQSSTSFNGLGLHGQGADLFRTGATVFSESTATARAPRAVLRAGFGNFDGGGLDGGGFQGGGLDRNVFGPGPSPHESATSVDGTLPADRSSSAASSSSLPNSLNTAAAPFSPESRT